VYTDGACHNNQGSNARAGVGVYFGPGHPDNVSRPVQGSRQTNQRAELEAIHDAVETIHRRNDGTNYEVKTDSAYAQNAFNKWGSNWQQNNWTTSKNEPVQHRDLIEPTLNRLNDLGDRVEISKVKGHSGNPGNDAADKLA
ncbi:ribonuclease H-like domain-containing protein, partial [Yarrowia lipolytica]